MGTSSFSISKDFPQAPHQPGPGFKFPKRSFGKKTVLPPVPLLPLQRGPRHRYKYSCNALCTREYGASKSQLTPSDAKQMLTSLHANYVIISSKNVFITRPYN